MGANCWIIVEEFIIYLYIKYGLTKIPTRSLVLCFGNSKIRIRKNIFNTLHFNTATNINAIF